MGPIVESGPTDNWRDVENKRAPSAPARNAYSPVTGGIAASFASAMLSGTHTAARVSPASRSTPSQARE